MISRFAARPSTAIVRDTNTDSPKKVPSSLARLRVTTSTPLLSDDHVRSY